MTETVDIYLTQGQSDWISLTWTEDGDPVDLTGWSALLQVRRAAAAEDVLFSASTDDGKITVDASGVVLVEIPAAESSAWQPSALAPSKIVDGATWTQFGVYDLELTDLSGQIVRLVHGRFWLSPEVSR